MSEKPGVIIYFDIIPALEKMCDSDAGALFRAIMLYAQRGELPSLDGAADLVFSLQRPGIDRDSKKYELKQLQARWKAYCREEKRHENEPLSFDNWLVENGLSIDINGYHVMSDDV